MKFITTLPRWVTWGLAFPLMVLNGWLFLVIFEAFQSLIAIFIIANLLAFILNYLVDFLVSHKIKRSRAVLLVIIGTVLLLGILGVTLAPVIINQLNELVLRLPSWIDSGSQQLQTLNDWAIARKLPVNLDALTRQLTEKLSSQLQTLTGDVLSFLLGTLGRVLDLVLTVVLTFYLLLHGEELWDGINEWLPQPIGSVLRQLLRQNFHNYYVGQASLATLFGISMTLAFLMLQLPFGLLFGLAVGVMAMFPFGVTVSVGLVSLLMALKSFWLGVRVLIVAALIQQVIDNGIAPRLLGGFIGLNPVWILLALLIGAQVGGVVGLLVAVPVAGFIKSAATVLRAKSIPPSEPALVLAEEQKS
jgi:predicted PurR-regulated permease PerM